MELSEVVANKTQGNAFCVTQFLRCLYDEGYLEYSSVELRFKWDLTNIQSQTTIVDNFNSLMERKLDRLPAETREILKVAACMGSRFEMDIVERAFGGSSVVDSQMERAVEEGLLVKAHRRSGLKFAHDQICKFTGDVVDKSYFHRL